MELLTGEDLDSHLRKHRLLASSDAVRIALPVVAALNAAHGSGVVHRDIKPSNIFLSVGPDDQLVPKVLDFGISKMSFDRAVIERMPTPRNQILGTPQYLPPEALRGPGAMGPLSDQYSLGIVLYQCVTGRTPFTGDTLLALLEALARGDFEPPRAVQPSVSAGLERVILRALSPEPIDRFPTIRDMGRALIELAAERTQTVWGQSFATPAPARLPTPSGAERPGPRGPSPSSEALDTRALYRPPPWRRLAIGAALLATGALAATFGPRLLPEPMAWGEPVLVAPAAEAPARPTAAAAALAPASNGPSSRVLALAPAPDNAGSHADSALADDVPSAAREAAAGSSPAASKNDRAARVRRALAAKPRPVVRTSKARAPKKPKPSVAPLSPPSSAQAPEAPQPPPEPASDSAPRAPDLPPSAPVIGANGAPILD
jgi:serine/threonine-protein kinase